MHYEILMKTSPSTWQVVYSCLSTMDDVKKFLSLPTTHRKEIGPMNVMREADIYAYNTPTSQTKYRWGILREVDD